MARADGRLGHHLLDDDKGPQDACGVVGIWAPDEDVARLAYFSLYALQHRGQESAGIAVSDSERILVVKDMGLVAQVFNEEALNSLTGHIAVGHTRYSTTGASAWHNAQPTFASTANGHIALGHNGNLTNTVELANGLTPVARRPQQAHRPQATSDTDVLTALLAAADTDDLSKAAMEVLPAVQGAFSLVFCDEQRLYAARDAQGVRPLSLGKLPNGWAVASETAALDIIGAAFVREIEPGEIVTIDADGVRSAQFAPAKPKGCLFEFVYLARPDSVIRDRVVHQARVTVGRRLAERFPADADLVIPVPESGTPAAIGYAQQSGIAFAQGLVKNSYVGRTFIQPSQTIRQLGIRLKLNPLREIIGGKRLVVVDDSIVRGNTQRAIVKMLREAGAAEVHVRISSPPVKWPCFYGIDFATRAELVAAHLDVDAVREAIGADSLGYVELDDLIESVDLPKDELCRACFDGEYPIATPPGTDLAGLDLDVIDPIVQPVGEDVTHALRLP